MLFVSFVSAANSSTRPKIATINGPLRSARAFAEEESAVFAPSIFQHLPLAERLIGLGQIVLRLDRPLDEIGADG